MDPQETTVTRLFTADEAHALLPTLQLSLAAIGQMRGEIERLLGKLAEGEPARVVEVLRGEVSPSPGSEGELDRVRELIAELGQAVEGIAAHGVIVRDLEPGTVDFPSVVEGRIALLCWQFGEPGLGYFHEAGESSEERRPLPDASVLLQ